MTANAYKEDEEKVIEAGMNAHVAKPVDVDILMSVLAKYVKSHAS
jgi:CheY-like chemotaxis protein